MSLLRALRSPVAVCTAFLLLSGIVTQLVQPGPGQALGAACSDGIDNDNDGETDYLHDHDCTSFDDETESAAGVTTLSITDNRTSARPGDTIIYAVYVSHPVDATLTVDVVMPAELEVIGAEHGGTITEDGVRWSGLTASPAGRTLIFTALVKHSAVAGNKAVVTARIGRLSASDMTVIGGDVVADSEQFDIDLDASTDTAAPGDTVTFDISVTNDSDTLLMQNIRVTLPRLTTLISVPDGAVWTGEALVWNDVMLDIDEELETTVTVKVPDRLRSMAPLVLSVTAGDAYEEEIVRLVDRTAVREISLSISDTRTTARPGDLLTYTVHASNDSPQAVTDLSLTASLPIYAEFVDATEGGHFDDSLVRWTPLTMAADGARTVSFTIRVRSDAPTGASLLAGVSMPGVRDSDSTRVVDRDAKEEGSSSSTAMSEGRSSSAHSGGVTPQLSANSSASSHAGTQHSTPVITSRPAASRAAVPASVPSQTVSRRSSRGSTPLLLLEKTSDSDEAVPGSVVRYTITVRNLLLNTMRDVILLDRFDPAVYAIVSNGGGTLTGSGRLVWNLPIIHSGGVWQASYTLRVHPDVEHGTQTVNTVSLTGTDVADAPLTERVRTKSVTVLRELPTTGASAMLRWLPLLATALLTGVFLVWLVVKKRG